MERKGNENIKRICTRIFFSTFQKIFLYFGSNNWVAKTLHLSNVQLFYLRNIREFTSATKIPANFGENWVHPMSHSTCMVNWNFGRASEPSLCLLNRIPTVVKRPLVTVSSRIIDGFLGPLLITEHSSLRSGHAWYGEWFPFRRGVHVRFRCFASHSDVWNSPTPPLLPCLRGLRARVQHCVGGCVGDAPTAQMWLHNRKRRRRDCHTPHCLSVN